MNYEELHAYFQKADERVADDLDEIISDTSNERNEHLKKFVQDVVARAFMLGMREALIAHDISVNYASDPSFDPKHYVKELQALRDAAKE